MAANTAPVDPFVEEAPPEPVLVYLSKAATLSLALIIGAFFFLGQFGIHLDTQYRTSFPFRLWVVADGDADIVLGDYVAFDTDDRTKAFFDPGTQLVKQVIAMPGDHVVIEGRNVWVNDQWIQALYLVKYLDKPLAEFARDFVVQPGHYWVMGTSPYSYDSRYWGTLKAEQIIGQAYPIW